MANVLVEIGIEQVKREWRKQYGTEPDVNSTEFAAFRKEANKKANAKTQAKAYSDSNVEEYAKKLGQIATKSPQSFTQEFYNAMTNLSKKGKINLCNSLLQFEQLPGDSKTWIQVVGNLFNDNKSESAETALSAMMESAKYPWISGLVNQRLFKEDDFNLDNFDASVSSAGGMGTDNSTSTDSTTTDTSADNTGDDFNLDDFGDDNGDLHIEPAGGLGGLGGMDMDGGDDMGAAPAPDTPPYRVIDVIFDEEDPEAAPKIKIQNMETGETELKDIFEIDV